jgi:hypothetical protein
MVGFDVAGDGTAVLSYQTLALYVYRRHWESSKVVMVTAEVTFDL